MALIEPTGDGRAARARIEAAGREFMQNRRNQERVINCPFPKPDPFRQSEREAIAASRRRSREQFEAQMRGQEVKPKLIERPRESYDVKKRWTLAQIKLVASRKFGFPLAVLESGQRSKDIVLARQYICYHGGRLTGLSLPQIGRGLGGRDHTTIIHARKEYARKRGLPRYWESK